MSVQATEVEVTVQATHGECIHCIVLDRRTNFKCDVTMVYGSNNLYGLMRLGAKLTTYRCICGNFNSPLSFEDRK